MTHNVDSDRIQRILDGEVELFAEIVDRWQRALINLAYRFCRDAAVAEELAQEAFLKAYRNLGRWRGDAAFSTWLFALTTNVCRSWCRRRQLPTVPLEALEVFVGERTTETTIEVRDRERLIREAVLSLPPKFRDAVVLYYFREMDVRETAAILGVAEGTVKSHLHRGRKLLLKHLPASAGHNVRGTGDKSWTDSIEFSSLSKN